MPESIIQDLPVPVIEEIMSTLFFEDASELSTLLSKQGVRVNPYQFFDPALGIHSFGIEFEENNIEALEGLVKNPKWNPSWNHNLAIRWAAKNSQHADIVQKLLKDPRVDPSANDNEAIITAATYGHTVIVEMLLRDARVNPAANSDAAIQRAATKGHTETVDLLLKDSRVTPSRKTLEPAADNGQSETVELLLKDPRVHQKDQQAFFALQAAYKQGHVETIKVLLRDRTLDVYDSDFYMGQAYDIMNLLGPHRFLIFFFYSKQVLKAYIDQLRLELTSNVVKRTLVNGRV